MKLERLARQWVWLAVALTAAKLWLTRGQSIFAIGPAACDDQLFLKLADSLLRGEWLGPYQQLTLAKGPFYSLWIATVFLVGLPLRLAEQLAYAGSCALVVRALAPALRNAWARLGVYALLLCNPMTYEVRALGRVLRQNIYAPLTLVIFAALIALYLRRGEPTRRLAPWAAALGLAGAGFWLTREESVWIVPSVVLLAAAALVGAWQAGGRRSLAAMLRATAIGAACAVLPVLAVCGLNARYYGWFGTVEFRAEAFADAYGALLRVNAGRDIPFVPVPREARELAYGVSPAFAELRPFLEGDLGQAWAANSVFLTHLPAEQRQIAGGWFMWALRDAVAHAGHARDARSALAFYRRIALEVNTACRLGRLPARPPRSGFLPPWREGQTKALARTFVEFADYFASFRSFDAHTPMSVGNDESLQLFRDLTGDRLAPSPEATELKRPRQTALDAWKVDALHRIGKVLRRVLFALVLAAHLLVLARAGQLAWQRQLTYPFVLAVAAWGACAACLLVAALVHVTSFPMLTVGSFAPAYPVLLLFVAAVAIDVATALAARRKGISSQNPAASD